MKNWSNIIIDFKNYLILERNMSDNTINAYISDVNKLVSFLEMQDTMLLPEDVNYDTLRDFITFIAQIGLDANSQSRIISGLRNFFKYLIIEDLISIDPTKNLETPRLGRRLPVVLSVNEIDKMISVIDLSTKLGHRNRAIIEVLYSCGLRVSELAELKISNIFFDDSFVKIVGKGDKQRLVPIGSIAINEINNYFKSFRNFISPAKGHGDYLFLNRRGKKLSRVMIFNIVKEACALAGITKTISPHTFRHSFATHLIEGGADLRVVQEMLGHESITTTEIYTHLDKSFLRNTIIQYHPRSK